ncbi:hypothetical protein [Nocardia sp. bgisy134]|uniref:hypothetical protein n=1 Tax=Nocardia sp. bgisy134 TaxID=3413789 RepID=UPI003D73B44D
MTTAERLRAEGHAEGRVEGRVEGRAEGRVETLIDLLTVKFGSLPAEIIDTIRATDPALVRTWALRVLTADAFNDVFA